MLLKNGSKGQEIVQLQTKLGLKADGSFGPATEKAVKEWQAANGLTADGIVGKSTWEKLFTGEKQTSQTDSKSGLSSGDDSKSDFKLEKLKGHVPDVVIEQIPDTAARFNITTPLRLAHFLAQCGHESGGFKLIYEGLNYSADRLKKIFPRYFVSVDSKDYERQPEKIANRVYSSRMGNGDEASGDGWRFRGRGYIQLTGRNNYTAFDETVDDDILADPDLVATKYPLSSAAYFFDSNKLWTICDKGADEATVTAVTKRVNGGIIGLDHRLKEFKKIYSLLS